MIMEVNFDDFVDPESQAASEPAPVTEPEPASEPVLTPESPRPRRKRNGGPKYTTAQKKEMEQAATLEHYMTVFTALVLVLPSAIGIWYLFGGNWVNTVQGILFFAVSGLLAAICIKHVQGGDSKQVGLRMWKGKRIPYLKQEGYALTVPYLWDLFLVDVTDKNTDFLHDQVMTSDGMVIVASSITWRVDYLNPFSVIQYLDAGTIDGVENIIDDPVEQGVRVHAISETSEEAQDDKEGFQNQIIDSLGKTEDKDYLADFKNGGKHLVLKMVGIEIIQLTVPDVMLPKGALERKLEISNEKYDTEKENLENAHNIEALQKLQKGTSLEPKDAAEFWLISQGKLPKTIHEEKITVSGLERGSDPLGLVTPFQLLGRSLSRSGSGQGDKGKKGGKNQK
jgi:hypothetical protein